MSQAGAHPPLSASISSRAAVTAAAASPSINSLPLYLRRHVNLGFDNDDVTALLSSIDSSQARNASSQRTTTTTTATSAARPALAQLPAELLLQIVEHVPVDYLLDWRLVCRGFRDAIDGQVLYHCLRRTRLLGYMGSRHSRAMESLDDDEDYAAIHLLEARFERIETGAGDDDDQATDKPIWSGSHAVFRVDDEWYRQFHRVGGAADRQGNTIDDADARWSRTLDRLELRRPEEGFGTLRWCIRLDHAVLDLDFPTEADRLHFDVRVNLATRCVQVAWRDMLVRFLKSERALRLMLDEKRNHSRFTFSHAEDCLRSLRRTRLAASLSPYSKVDRHIRWSLRLLHPLFGCPPNEHTMTLENVENDAIHKLLLLRRAASLSGPQLAYLDTLAKDYRAMEQQLRRLDDAYAEFKTYLSVPGFQMNILLPAMVTNAGHVPRDPVAWTDELREKIEFQVQRWKGQRDAVEQVGEILEASNEAMGVPDDSFDELGSEF
ncbi:hypothetical protein COCCADRAFT_110333 [Bipolaris zeicola 26-R-13]|uniref:F-box domain-containing protein n=1 Tax=Cochliobolus carbonum (strain 26-R-13) TaxID=930089 RepID=W6XZ18_COCC2|nr:uncharacterized protein COCCADRAFT_110333 [Bipolaris zeicola 26-R-13]EUC27984.1 hypothetical protein COCCADRAFT_110333 [Bipolaris zeicola 26-R-13]